MNENPIPPCYYRVSVKALILDETRTKFLVVQEGTGCWEFPGGGLEWGAAPQEDLKREIQEEMGLEVLSVAQNPSYFVPVQNDRGVWVANVFYKTVVKDFSFTPSDECIAVRFVTPDEALALPACFGNIARLTEVFRAE